MMAHGDPRSKLGMQSHLDFHLTLARSGGFPRLAEELERLWFRRLMRLNWVKATHYKRVPDDWHASLVEVIESRDPNAADAKMREHVRYGSEDDRQAIEFVLTQINEPEDSSTLED
jgi:DNA-binding GntR family transcriptional regulator